MSAGGGADAAVITRISSGWKKFRELQPILTAKYVSRKSKGILYMACVRSVMIYGAETWPMKKDNSSLLERAEMRMVRWMCGVTLRDHIRSEELRKSMGILSIEEMLRRARLRWFGHVMRKEYNDWVKRCTKLEVQGNTSKGPRKTWMRTLKEDMKLKGLKVGDCSNRQRWRKVLNTSPKPAQDAD